MNTSFVFYCLAVFSVLSHCLCLLLQISIAQGFFSNMNMLKFIFFVVWEHIYELLPFSCQS